MNTESEQLKVMNQSVLMLDKLDINQEKNVVLADDFNVLTYTKLDTMCGSPALKTKSLAKLQNHNTLLRGTVWEMLLEI